MSGDHRAAFLGSQKTSETLKAIPDTIKSWSARLALLATGVLIGGTIGIGTVIHAVRIGPLAHIFIPIFQRVAEPRSQRTRH